MMNELTKVCRACCAEKSSDDFGRVQKGRGDRFNRPSRCKACRNARNLLWHVNSSERSKRNHDQWLAENAAHISAYNKAKRAAEPEVCKQRFDKWAKGKEGYFAAKANARRFRKIQASPSWLTAIELSQIHECYEIAHARGVQTGVPHHVDHVFPLGGNGYVGLHVPWNLEVSTEFDNLSKKNRDPAAYAPMFWSAS